MKLESFKEKNKKKKVIIGGSIFVVILISMIILIRSFALFEAKQEYNVISGVVPRFSDITISFILEENGSQKVLNTMPEGKDYTITVKCNKNATGNWDYESWGPVIGNLSESLTRCQIIFSKAKFLENVIKENIVTIGSGVYEVSHSDTEITAPLSELEKNNLKQMEYRYAGANPNNYIQFNNELWRVIGLVNNPEGSRVKLMRNESIGNYSWDSSETSINSGNGINEWSRADLMKLLNPGFESESIGGSLFYNIKNGTCYNGNNNSKINCDFTKMGLQEQAKSKIDTITWNIGTDSLLESSDYRTVKNFFQYERSNGMGKICTSGLSCTDTVNRTNLWKGKVGLMYISDYGYATSGNTSISRETCLNNTLYTTNIECANNNWLNKKNDLWTLNPAAILSLNSEVFYLSSQGKAFYSRSHSNYQVYPSIYLTLNQKVMSGDGSQSNPYILI